MTVKHKKLNVLYYCATTTACELLEIHPAGLLSILLRNQVQRFHRNFVSKEERLRKEKESKLTINEFRIADRSSSRGETNKQKNWNMKQNGSQNNTNSNDKETL